MTVAELIAALEPYRGHRGPDFPGCQDTEVCDEEGNVVRFVWSMVFLPARNCFAVALAFEDAAGARLAFDRSGRLPWQSDPSPPTTPAPTPLRLKPHSKAHGALDA